MSVVSSTVCRRTVTFSCSVKSITSATILLPVAPLRSSVRTREEDLAAATALQDGVGAGTYVYTGGSWVYGDTDGVQDETAPWNPPGLVVGPEGGDFAGWVRDPDTGYLVDPATGQEYDPVTGRFVDPVTGKPFGDVRQYVSRLEGLPGTSGPAGLLADRPGGIGLMPTGGGLAPSPNLFGGAVPPSLFMSNPAVAQLRATARNSMAAKAYAANELALSEARQGGRSSPCCRQGRCSIRA